MNRSGKRRPGQTAIGISISQELVDLVDELANREGRSRSNWVAYHLPKLIRLVKVETTHTEESAQSIAHGSGEQLRKEIQ